MKGKPTRGEEFKCYMIWQIMMALLHSNRQLRTERDGDTEKGCQKPAVQQKTTDDDIHKLRVNGLLNEKQKTRVIH